MISIDLHNFRTQAAISMIAANGKNGGDMAPGTVADDELLTALSLLPKKKRRAPVPWSEDECVYLVHGVKKFGHHWAQILKAFKPHFHAQRTGCDLKDKFKNLSVTPEKIDIYNEIFVKHFNND